MVYTHVAAAILAAAVAAAGAWRVQEYRWQNKEHAWQKADKDATIENMRLAKIATEKNISRLQDAYEDQATKYQRAKVDGASVDAELVRLRDANAERADQLTDGASPACRAYAATARAVLDSCAQEYTEMARAAGGHAADAAALTKAWPTE